MSYFQSEALELLGLSIAYVAFFTFIVSMSRWYINSRRLELRIKKLEDKN